MASIPFPPTIDFSNIKPKGYSAQIINREFTPAPFNASIAQQDLIRFMINQHRGFWDPYSAYLDVEVDFSAMSTTGVLQLDGSAHSLISRFQLYVNGTSLELIDEYDTVLHFLHDMQMARENKKIKMSEGVGQDQGGFDSGSQNWVDQCNGSWDLAPSGVTGGSSTLFGYTPHGNQWLMDTSRVSNANQVFDNSQGLVTNQSSVPLILSNQEPNNWNTNAEMLAYLNTNTAQQANNVPLNRYEQQLFANNFTWSPVNLTSNINKEYPGRNSGGLFAGNFCNQNFEQMFSVNYPQYHIKNGNVGAQSVIPIGSFQFPLGSSILGTLLPSDSYKYIPFTALTDLVLEFTLNKYAFFTSGYVEDVNTAAGILTNADLGCRKTPITQQQRTWKINKFNLNVDIIIFDDAAIEDMVNAQLVTNGVLLHTCGWTMALKQVFGTTGACAGNFQINYGFESLKALFLLYELNDYQTYSFCRKHFRCSRNVTQLQVRIGEKLYPQQPLQGHGGNALKYNPVTKTNQAFVQELYKAFNKQFTINSEASINMANFCPNKRSYNVIPVTQLGAFFYDNPAAPAPNTWIFNYDVQVGMGQTLMFENALRGMAVYCINFDVLGNDNNVMGGVDTKMNVPFNVLVQTDTTDTGNFPNGVNIDLVAEREVTGMFLCYYDVLYLFKANQAPQKIGAQ